MLKYGVVADEEGNPISTGPVYYIVHVPTLTHHPCHSPMAEVQKWLTDIYGGEALLKDFFITENEEEYVEFCATLPQPKIIK